MPRIYIPLLLSVLLLLGSCKGKQNNPKPDTLRGTAVPLEYAELFTITDYEDYSAIIVHNPWKPGEIYEKYYLVRNENNTTPGDGVKVKIPVQSMMANSATHLGFLDILNGLDCVTGVCNVDFIYNPVIRQRVTDGKVEDLGDSFNLDIERLLLLRPQAVMTTAYNADDENSRRMKQTGLAILYNIEWQEKTLLGRAEWIKFVAAFLDKRELADDLFNETVRKYNEVKALAASVVEKPTVLSGQDFRGSWSMPGGKSFNSQLFSDAGGDYYYKEDTSTGSISTSIEEALLHFGNADIWVGVRDNTLEELGKTDSKYKLFKAYRTGEVYNTNKRTNATGGNDYWEGAVARPDLLLSDMVKMFHPALLPDYELTYMQKLSK